MKMGITTYVPYRNIDGLYRTGLTKKRMKELELTNEDYNPFDERVLVNKKINNFMIYRNNEGYPTDEITKA